MKSICGTRHIIKIKVINIIIKIKEYLNKTFKKKNRQGTWKI